MAIAKMIPNEIFYVSVCSLGFLDFLSYSLPTVLYPQLAETRGMDSFDIAVVFTLCTFGKFFGAFISADLLARYSEKSLLIAMLIFGNFGKFAFGCIEFFDDETSFIILSIMSRIIVGFSTGVLIAILYSIISNTWPNELMSRISWFEISQAIAVGIGPPLASLLYNFGGFFVVFAIFAIVTLSAGLVLVWKCTGNFTNKVEEKKKKPLSIVKAFFTLRILALILFQTVIYSSLLVISSQYELHIIDLGGTVTLAAWLYSLNMVGYVLALFIVAKLLKSGQNAIFMFTGSIMNVAALFFQGPDPIFGIEDSVTKFILIGIALAVSGLGEGLCLIVLVAEYINELNQRFPGEPQLCNDLSGGLFAIGFTLGEFCGQMVGGVLMEFFGYYDPIRYYAFALFGFLVLLACYEI